MKKHIILIFASLILTACGGSKTQEQGLNEPPKSEAPEPTPAKSVTDENLDNTKETPEINEPATTVPEQDLSSVALASPSKFKTYQKNDMVLISWPKVENAQSYNVYISSTSESSAADEVINTTTNNFKHSNLNQSEYSYRIQSVAGNQRSGMSSTITVKLFNTKVIDNSL
ncbi:hypothetical protein [Thalassomonas sp. M1454]|uniref:hypothetical protein n=1 Tax=Thalassomonas sp. M1454 TaxID=2594477 RepID=UPI00117BEC0D|nr:hypothetical protein [Thalassomonas sp. M1454]TRX57210.1 hypothetical protein FNN08_06840 [Thalassomonas sp. M1454]